MQTSDEAVDGIYSEDKDLKFQIQLGSKLCPEFSCRSMTECVYRLRKAFNLPMFHQQSMSVSFRHYRDRQFIFAFSFEKVPDSCYTGINTRAGQQMLVKIEPEEKSIPTVDVPENAYTPFFQNRYWK